MRDFDYLNFETEIEGEIYSVKVENIGDDDCNKMYVNVIFPDGHKESPDWSPYESFGVEALRAWLKHGKPTRKSLNRMGPIRLEDLMKL